MTDAELADSIVRRFYDQSNHEASESLRSKLETLTRAELLGLDYLVDVDADFKKRLADVLALGGFDSMLADSSREKVMITLECALDLYERGCSVIPTGRDKKPRCKNWKRFQTDRPDQSMIRTWFGGDDQEAMAVVMGQVSGNLACRDFDKLTSYEEWKADHPDLARALPTVATGRPGCHVYARIKPMEIQEASRSGSTIIHLYDGEVRAGGYCQVPPSLHPGGAPYSWLVPLGDEIPTLGLVASGFLPPKDYQCNTENIGGPRHSVLSTPSVLHGKPMAVDGAILRTLPTSFGQRHRCLFNLARELRAVPELGNKPASELKPIIQSWHQLALPHIRTKPFEESWIDFFEAWDKVKYPVGQGPIEAMFAKAIASHQPKVAQNYEQPKLRLLIALCRELQRGRSGEPFYLSTRTAGQLLGVDHTVAWRWLKLLQVDSVIRETEKGSKAKRKASLYRYLDDV